MFYLIFVSLGFIQKDTVYITLYDAFSPAIYLLLQLPVILT
jgi:hypothetical protein